MRSVYSFHSAMVFACDSAPCVFGCQLCNFPYLSRCGGSGYCRNHDFAFQMESVDRPGYKAPRRSRSFRKNAYGVTVCDDALYPILAA